MKKWVLAGLLVLLAVPTVAFLAGAPVSRPDTWLPASKLRISGFTSQDLQSALDTGEIGGGGVGGGSIGNSEHQRRANGFVDFPVLSGGYQLLGHTASNTLTEAKGDPDNCWLQHGTTGKWGLVYTYGDNCLPGVFYVEARIIVTNDQGTPADQTINIQLATDLTTDACSTFTEISADRVESYVLPADYSTTLTLHGIVQMSGGSGNTSDCVVVRGHNTAEATVTFSVENYSLVAIELTNSRFSYCRIVADDDWDTDGRGGLACDANPGPEFIGRILRGGVISNDDAAGAVEVELNVPLEGDQFFAVNSAGQNFCFDTTTVGVEGTDSRFLYFGGGDGDKVCSTVAGSTLSCVAILDLTDGDYDWVCSGVGWTNGGA